MGKIRVLHCLQDIGSGGVEQRRLALAKHLDPDKYQQAIICTQAYGGIPEQLEDVGCKVHPVGLLKHPFDFMVHLNVLKVIKEFKPHIIHGAVFEGVTMAAICGSLSRVPIIIGEETSDPKNRSWKGNLLLKGLSMLTHKMVGVSSATCDYLINKININDGKVVLINNGVEVTSESSREVINEIYEELKIQPDNFVIGFVGRLFDDCKRVSDLISAFSIIVEKYPKSRLLIVGDGPDKKTLNSLALSLNISDKVIFVGYQSDTRKFYDIMNVFVLPSATESFGLVLVEAMFAKLPVVASRVGGIPYIVSEGETGFLFEPKNVKELSERLLYIINNPLESFNMGVEGYKVAIDKFSAERYCNDVNRLYQKLLSGRKVTELL